MIGGQLQNYDTKSLVLAAESLSYVRTLAFHIYLRQKLKVPIFCCLSLYLSAQSIQCRACSSALCSLEGQIHKYTKIYLTEQAVY